MNDVTSTVSVVTRPIRRPSELDLDSPGRRDYWVALEHDSIWGDHLIPLTVMVGPEVRQGNGVVAFGSNHGNEYEGPVAIKHLIRRIDPKQVRGRVILMPVLNPSAFSSGTRESVADDSANLNRCFVDGAGRTPGLSSITYRIAAFVREFVWPRVHVVIDIHSAADVAKFTHCITYHLSENPDQERRILETARWFGTPMIVALQSATVGLLFSEAHRLGKIAISSELGWGKSICIEGVRRAVHGILAAAVNHEQMHGTISPIDHHRDGSQLKVAMVDRACYTPAPFSGHFEPMVDIGHRLKSGDCLGLLHDFTRIDENPWPAVSAVDGVLAAHAWSSPVTRGQHIAVVARVLGSLERDRSVSG